MEQETAEFIGQIFSHIENIERVVWFVAPLIWIVIYYILYQIFRLKFLKLFISAEAVGILYWIWSHLYYFTGVPTEPNDSLSHITLVWFIEITLRFTPQILYVIGGVICLKYLQVKYKEIANQRVEPTVKTSVD